ncbi:hypothetical protein AB0J55_02045 [Amycolatopsis sp. NPDC049688]|uniref:hypothetical protein n=1 Tax=Amycolatopsis sp. NPDC049688 TaxID=3154733 RepID=UPI00343998EE
MTGHEENSISVQAGTTVSGGTINGNVSGGSVTMGPVSAGSAPPDLVALLRQLKGQVVAAGLSQQNTTADHLDELIEQARSPHPEPGVGRWCWTKVTAALAGIKEFDDLVGRIAGHLAALWPG